MKRFIGKRKLIRIFISNEEKCHGKPLWEHLLLKAKEMDISGATVIKGVAGFGAHSEIMAFNVWSLSQKLPLIIEIIDTEEKITKFMRAADDWIEEAFVTMTDVEVVAYKHPKHRHQ
ncbi:DUF190 domain-containing protein [Hydrogenimonas urashimensis]|uniref:DUF190 domain-containing protein n=1 Tax=Hydrogenimonas urashimensis TaxID=2740515 RepID=UPI001916B3BA|nr:DUF190 domain-containing protein [Hydrogenimonas urashimensis]